MNALVVYESHWGNTAAVARAVAEGIGEDTPALSTGEADATVVPGLDLLVVGAPVLGFRLSNEQMYKTMRAQPSKANPPDLSHPPVSAWLKSVPAGAATVAAFDTRVRGPFGKAAPAILKILQEGGYHSTFEPEGFVVKGAQGPMREGELDRAREWGRKLAETVNGGR